MFAQINHNDAVQIGLWVIAATAVLQALGAALSILRFFVHRAEKREVSISAGVVARPDFDTLVADNKHEHENLHARLGAVERVLQREVNAVAQKVSGLERETSLQNQRLAQIDAKLDRVIERQNA